MELQLEDTLEFVAAVCSFQILGYNRKYLRYTKYHEEQKHNVDEWNAVNETYGQHFLVWSRLCDYSVKVFIRFNAFIKKPDRKTKT